MVGWGSRGLLDEWALVGVDGLGRGLGSRMGLGGVDLTGMGGSVERAIHDPHQFLSQWLPSHLAAHLPYVHCATNFCLNFSPVCYKTSSKLR